LIGAYFSSLSLSDGFHLSSLHVSYHSVGVYGSDEASVMSFLMAEVPSNLYALGRSKVFFKEAAIQTLDERRHELLLGAVKTLQSMIRRWRARAIFDILRDAERQRREEIERRRREEEERKRREVEEKRRKEEDERRRKEEEEIRKKEEMARRAIDEERRRQEQADALRRQQDERYEAALREREDRELGVKRPATAVTKAPTSSSYEDEYERMMEEEMQREMTKNSAPAMTFDDGLDEWGALEPLLNHVVVV